MKNLRFCTLTGVDSRTDLLRIAELAKLFPVSEWGVLFNPATAGKDNRYPDLDTVWSVGKFLRKLHINAAVHLCGSAVQRLVAGDPVVRTMVEPFGRIQLNLLAKRFDAQSLRKLGEDVLASDPAKRIIVQMNAGNAGLCRQLAGSSPFEFLFDSSGGRGVACTQWPSLAPSAEHGIAHAPCGFAGGLGPDTIGEQLPRIVEASAGNPFWLDMEGRLRGEDDFFDLDRAETVLRAVAAFESQLALA